MSEMHFWRRDLLKAGAGGMLLVGVGSQAATADTGEKNVLLDEDFRDYEPGDFPTGWDTAGNTDQEVVSSPSLSHDRAFRYSGSAGGCWEAIAQSPEKSAIASEGTTVINGDVRVGSGSHGCHSDTAQIKISTCDDGWPCGEKQRFISFADTGRIEVSGADDDLGSWTQNKWYSFTITYERSDGQVTYTVEVEGEETTVEKEEGGFEDEIAHLWLNTGGYTNYVDNLKITYDDSEISGDPGSGSFNAQNGLAINDGTAYLVEDSEIKLVSLDTRSVINRFDAPDGRPRGLAYGNGSLWFADGVEPDYDGEILELDPDTGRVRSRIDTSYDPRGLAFDEGSLWVINITSNDIEEYSPNGRRVGGFDIRGPTGVTFGRGLAYFNGSLWVGEFAGSNGSSTASLYEFTTDGEFVQETGKRTFPDGEGGGYGGLATTSTELLGPDEDGNLTVLRTLGEGDDPESSGTITGRVTDINGSLEDVAVTILNDDGNTVTNTTTNNEGEFRLEIPTGTYEVTATKPNYETETADVTVNVGTTHNVSLGLAFTDPLADERAAKLELADRLETITEDEIRERSEVATIFDEYDALLQAEEVDTGAAEEAVERLILAEEVINRALEVTGAAEPRDESRFDYNMAANTWAALFQGIIEWKLGLIEIKRKLAELSGYKDIISAALDYLEDAVKDLIVEQIGDVVSSDKRIEFDEQTLELAEVAADAYELAQNVRSGDLRAIVEELVDPVARQFGRSSQFNLEESGSSELLADNSPGYEDQIGLSLENTRPEIWDQDTSYELSNPHISHEDSIIKIGHRAQSLADTLEPEHDGLLELLSNVLDLLRADGFFGIISVLRELASFIWDRLPIVAEGFNAGQGIVETEFIVDDCYDGVTDIVGREPQ